MARSRPRRTGLVPLRDAPTGCSRFSWLTCPSAEKSASNSAAAGPVVAGRQRNASGVLQPARSSMPPRLGAVRSHQGRGRARTQVLHRTHRRPAPAAPRHRLARTAPPAQAPMSPARLPGGTTIGLSHCRWAAVPSRAGAPPALQRPVTEPGPAPALRSGAGRDEPRPSSERRTTAAALWALVPEDDPRKLFTEMPLPGSVLRTQRCGPAPADRVGATPRPASLFSRSSVCRQVPESLGDQWVCACR